MIRVPPAMVGLSLVTERVSPAAGRGFAFDWQESCKLLAGLFFCDRKDLGARDRRQERFRIKPGLEFATRGW